MARTFISSLTILRDDTRSSGVHEVSNLVKMRDFEKRCLEMRRIEPLRVPLGTPKRETVLRGAQPIWRQILPLVEMARAGRPARATYERFGKNGVLTRESNLAGFEPFD